MILTEQRKRDPKDEDHDTTTQRQQKVTRDHDSNDKQSGVLPFEVLDCGLVLSGPHRTSKHQTHHSSSQKHAKWVEKPEKKKNDTVMSDWGKTAQPAGGSNSDPAGVLLESII